MALPRVLLVDDNPDNLELLARLLAERYTVASHRSAAAALGALDAVNPDVVVLDTGMATIDGVQYAEAIRALVSVVDAVIESSRPRA